MTQDNDCDYDLQPADDIGCGDLDIVFRSLNFATSSNGQSPVLVIILAEDNVCFRVLYGWDQDDFDDVFSTDLVGRTCRVSGIGPRYLTDFSAWLRDVSGATGNSSVSRLPRPICQSAREMWEILCELKQKFAADAFCLGKEIRRRVEAWEVVNADLDNFFMDTNEEPSEEDRASVFGSADSSSSSPSLPPPAPPLSPSPAALVPTSSSLDAEAAVFEPALSSATTTTTASAPAQQKLSCRQRKWAREVAFREKIAEKIQKRIAKREALAAASSTSSTPSSTSSGPKATSSTVVSRKDDSGKFKKPLPTVRKSVVVVPGPTKHSPASSTVASVPGAKKRERSAGPPAPTSGFPVPAPSASLEDDLCQIIDRAQSQDAASPHAHARKRAHDRSQEREEAVRSGVITSFFANNPSSSSSRGRGSSRRGSSLTSPSSRVEISPSTSSSTSAPPPKRSKVEYESKRSLRRQYEEMGTILNLLNLPRSVISTREVEDLVDRASRAHAESRDRSRSPLPSSSTSSSSRTSRSPSRSSSSQRRSPSSSTSRSSSAKDRLGVRAPLADEAAAGTSSSYSPMYSVDNPPPRSVYRCSDVRLTSGEVSGYTERADERMESSETSSERERSSRKDWKGKGRGKKSGGGKK